MVLKKTFDNSALFQQELSFDEQTFIDHKILVGARVLAANLKIGSFATLNTLAAPESDEKVKLLSKTCLKNEGRCAKLAVLRNEVDQYVRKYDIDFKLLENSQETDKIQSVIEYSLKPENERLSALATIKERKYGFDVERIVSSANRLIKIKAILPKRISEMHVEYQPSNNGIIGKAIFYHDTKKPAEKLLINFDRKFSQSGSQHVYDYSVTLDHQSIKEPLTIKSKYVIHKKTGDSSFFGLGGQDYSITVSHGQQKLTWESNWMVKNGKFNYRFRLYSGDEKIDFGCVGGREWMKRSFSKRSYECHWVDRNGRKQIMKKNQEMSLEKESEKFSFLKQIKNPFMEYKLAGKVHLADLLNLAEFDLTFFDGSNLKTKMSVETVDDAKCFVMTTKSDRNSQVYKLRSCVNLRPRGDQPLFTLNINEEGKEEQIVSFKIVRMAEFARDFRVTLKWNPQSVTDTLVS